MLHKTSKQEKSNYTNATRKGVKLHWKFIGNSITVLHINSDLPLCANKTSKLVWVLCNFLNGFMSLTWIMELLSYFFLACKDSPINCKKKNRNLSHGKEQSTCYMHQLTKIKNIVSFPSKRWYQKDTYKCKKEQAV